MARGAIKLAALAGLAKQARDYARNNPDSVSATIGKIESTVSRKVGPKYAAHVGKGGNAVRSGLGIPASRPGRRPAAGGSRRARLRPRRRAPAARHRPRRATAAPARTPSRGASLRAPGSPAATSCCGARGRDSTPSQRRTWGAVGRRSTWGAALAVGPSRNRTRGSAAG